MVLSDRWSGRPSGRPMSGRPEGRPLHLIAFHLTAAEGRPLHLIALHLTALALALTLAGGTLPAASQATPWSAGHGPLETRWARLVSPKNAHPEYPRPQ